VQLKSILLLFQRLSPVEVKSWPWVVYCSQPVLGKEKKDNLSYYYHSNSTLDFQPVPRRLSFSLWCAACMCIQIIKFNDDMLKLMSQLSVTARRSNVFKNSISFHFIIYIYIYIYIYTVCINQLFWFLSCLVCFHACLGLQPGESRLSHHVHIVLYLLMTCIVIDIYVDVWIHRTIGQGTCLSSLM